MLRSKDCCGKSPGLATQVVRPWRNPPHDGTARCSVKLKTIYGKRDFQSTCGLVAMTSVSHAEGRQFDPGQVYWSVPTLYALLYRPPCIMLLHHNLTPVWSPPPMPATSHGDGVAHSHGAPTETFDYLRHALPALRSSYWAIIKSPQ